MAKKAKQKLSKSAAAYNKEISRIKSAISKAKSQGWNLPSYDVSYYIPEKPKIIRPSDVKAVRAIDYDRIINKGTKAFFSGKGFFKQDLTLSEYRKAQKENRARKRKTKYWNKKGARISWDFFGNETVFKDGQIIRENGKPVPTLDIEPPEPQDITPPEPPDFEDTYDPYEYRQQPGDNVNEYQQEEILNIEEANTISQAEVIIENLRDTLAEYYEECRDKPSYEYNEAWRNTVDYQFNRMDTALVSAGKDINNDFAIYIIENSDKLQTALLDFDTVIYSSDVIRVSRFVDRFISLLETGLGAKIFTLEMYNDFELDDSDMF